jgi:DNA-binding Xre family transcriptional regulator
MAKLRIKEIAEKRGLNISDLMRLTGLSYPGTHALWHNRTSRVNLDTLTVLAQALGVQVGELFEESKNGDNAPFRDMGANIERTPELMPIPAR